MTDLKTPTVSGKTEGKWRVGLAAVVEEEEERVPMRPLVIR
jgi:hypothetical protein